MTNIDTQSQRRVKYGLNVAVAIIVAILLAVLINWISYRNFRSGSTRWDLTSTRQYSLSPLTRKVLDRFEGEFRFVTLLDASEGSREDTQRARDLVEEYARASSKVKIEHINPATELTKREAFEKAIHSRFAAQFEVLDKLNARGIAALESAKNDVEHQRAIIQEVLKDKTLKETDPRRASLFQTERFFEAQADALGKSISTIGAYKLVPLPNYSSALVALKETVESLDVGFYPQVLKTRINPLIEDSRTPDLVKDGLLALSESVTKAMALRKPLLVELTNTKGVPQYDALLSRLGQPNPIVILGPTDAVAINLAELFRAASQAPDRENKPRAGELEEKQFLGEERLTGVLARLTITQLNPPPMVVFVSIGSGLGGKPKRDYAQLLDRLNSMGLQVQTWEPINVSPFVDPNAKPAPAPQPKPGQRAVWVLLPGDPPDPQNPTVEKSIQTTITLLRDRLDQGDGLLTIVPPEVVPAALEGTILHEWAIEVDTHQVLLREVINRYGQTQAYNEHDIRVWPQELAVSKAIGEAGMTAHFVWASPISLIDARRPPNAKYFPLAILTGKNLWGNLSTADEARSGRAIQMDAVGDVQRESFTIALAAEQPPIKEGNGVRRVVVISDQFFATDRFGAAEFADPVTKRVRQMTPYPGNHELFVNSVYWLAGIEELIAASARTQDVRRVGAMSPAELSTLQWTMLIGMPLGTFVVGIGVWMTRRR